MYKGYVLPWQRILKSFRWLDFFSRRIGFYLFGMAVCV